MDRRLTPATDRKAHRSLIGRVEGRTFTEGEALAVAWPLVDLLAAPGGARDRQLWLGDGFTVIDRDQGHAFGFAHKDGYCGWLPGNALENPARPTHWVATTASHLYAGPKVQSRDIAALPMGARLAVAGITGSFAQTPHGFVPLAHLRGIGDFHADPVSVAEMFLGTPYLWGGNSHVGLDCSGLVQVAHLACAHPCPADSNLQQKMGRPLDADEPLRRGDLLFWQGHVALVATPDRLIHANAHSMTVAHEATAACIARIAAQGGGPVIHRVRP
ncbi:MAG: NlpC/P60 family protein [Pseudomonadota bacterium]